MIDRVLNAAFFRSLVFLAITGAVSVASAVAPRCANLFESSPQVEELIERVGLVEKMVNAWVAEPIPHVDPNRVAVLAIRVSEVVEKLLSEELFPRANIELVLLIEAEATAIKGERIAEILNVSARSFGLEPPAKYETHPFRSVPIARLGIKDLAHLPPHLREKFDDFQHVLSDLPNPLAMDPKWDLEKIQMRELNLPGRLFTVRLNQGYRVLFSFETHGLYTIQRIRKDLTH